MKKPHERTFLARMALIAIITIALISCSDGGGYNSPPPPPQEQPQKKPDTTRTLSFGTNCKVTIKSDDLFLTAEWDTLCDKVVAAIERGYGVAITGFTTVFASDQNAKVVLGNNFTYNWEIKTGETRTVYIKTTSIDTVSFSDIVVYMGMNSPAKNPSE
jgi:hypothetical protein